MNLSLLLSTVHFLNFRQVVYQIRRRFYNPNLKEIKLQRPSVLLNSVILIKKQGFLCNQKDFSFLNVTSSFNSWNDTSKGMLWAYNLNYMDWLCQELSLIHISEPTRLL